MRVLVVEDEEPLADLVARGLRHEMFAVDVATDGADGLLKARINDYDVIVLDRDLPGVHGDELCRRLTEGRSSSRILMLTASGEIADRVTGLQLGADDYLAKPFAFAELVARVRALMRREGRPLPPVLERAGLRLDPGRREVTRDGMPVILAPKEFAMLELLMRAEGRVISAEEMLARVWDENVDPFTTVVRATVRTLRQRIGNPPVIETVIGAGYRIP